MTNQRGQVSIEMILMMAVLLSATIAVSRYFSENNTFSGLVQKPWLSLAGLIQNGVVGTPKDTMAKHPNQYLRFSSVQGDQVP